MEPTLLSPSLSSPRARAEKKNSEHICSPISSGTVSGVFWFPVVSVAFLHTVRYICVLVHRGQRGNVGYILTHVPYPLVLFYERRSLTHLGLTQ